MMVRIPSGVEKIVDNVRKNIFKSLNLNEKISTFNSPNKISDKQFKSKIILVMNRYKSIDLSITLQPYNIGDNY